ncbi:MAG: PliI family lysozyme inhibitor of I-type lysozyme [Thermotogota bacterium]
MKKVLIFLFVSLLIMAFSVEKEIPYEKFQDLTFENVNYILNSKTDDIDNDGVNENIMIIGELKNDDSPFVRNIKLVISNRKETFILYKNAIEDGYETTIELADFNGDSNKDILIKNSTGGSGGYINVKLLSFNGTYLEELFSSENVYYDLEGNFEKDFKAIIELENYFEYKINLDHKKEIYIESEFYSEDGELLADSPELMIGGIAQFEVVNWGDKNVIRYSKSVSGFYHADRLGYLELILDFTDGEMNIDQAYFNIILY